jgi:hypothetical protein
MSEGRSKSLGSILFNKSDQIGPSRTLVRSDSYIQRRQDDQDDYNTTKSVSDMQNSVSEIDTPVNEMRNNFGPTPTTANLLDGKIQKFAVAERNYVNSLYQTKQLLKERNKYAPAVNKIWGLVPVTTILLIIIFILCAIIVIAFLSAKVDNALFTNKLDVYGTGIRFNQYRDDSGSSPSSLHERQYGSKPFVIEPLTSSPEPPNISEFYGIEANLKDGKVMIERENFENSALSLNELEKANKGF